MSEEKQNLRKPLIVVGIVIALWYGLMLARMLLPQIADAHGVLAFPASMKNTLKHVSMEEQSYDGAKALLDKLGWQHSWRDITYKFKLSQPPDVAWELIAYPNKNTAYHYPLIKRILFLDFYKHKVHTYRIMPEAKYVETVQ